MSKKVVRVQKKKHIDVGVRGRPSSCMVALAIKDLFPNATTVFAAYGLVDVEYNVDGVTKEDRWWYVDNGLTADEVNENIRAFDRGDKVKPFKFSISDEKPSL